MAGDESASHYPVQLYDLTNGLLFKDAPSLLAAICGKNEQSDQLKDLPLVVLSIAGRSRQGKSFLLNFILRYLRHRGSSSWLEDEGELKGFDWITRPECVTKGILLWPEIFKIPSGDSELSVLLMDTQGVFDTDTDQAGSTKLFTLSMVLSSVQVFNVMHRLCADDLDRLSLFAQLAEASCTKDSTDSERRRKMIFDTLVFLVRDWQCPDDIDYGWEGGRQYLHSKLNDPTSSDETKTVATRIQSTFRKLECCLMPDPGEAAKRKAFNGSVNDPNLSRKFAVELKELVVRLCDDLFEPKKLQGRTLTLADWCEFVTGVWPSVHNNETANQMTSLTEAIARHHNGRIIEMCTRFFDEHMRRLADDDLQALVPSEFELKANAIVDEMLAKLQAERTMGPQPDTERRVREDILNNVSTLRVKLTERNATRHNERMVAEMVELFSGKMHAVEAENPDGIEDNNKFRSLCDEHYESVRSKFNSVVAGSDPAQARSKRHLDAKLDEQLKRFDSRNSDRVRQTEEARLKAEEARLKADKARAEAELKAEEARLKADKARAEAELKAEEARLKADKARAEAKLKAEEARAKVGRLKFNQYVSMIPILGPIITSIKAAMQGDL